MYFVGKIFFLIFYDRFGVILNVHSRRQSNSFQNTLYSIVIIDSYKHNKWSGNIYFYNLHFTNQKKEEMLWITKRQI